MMKKVEGEKSDHEVLIYTLSTCMWCKKTKRFLEENSVEFQFEDVDLLSGDERERVVDALEKYNPAVSFPTVVVDGEEVVVGFNETGLKGVLGR